MAFPHRYLNAWLVLWFAPVAMAPAQPAPPALRQLSFTVFSAVPVGPLCYVAKPGAVPTRLAFYPTARSPQYAYRGPPTVQLLEVESGAVVAEFIIPPRMQRALVILLAEDTPHPGPVHYQVEVYDDGGQQHEPGAVLILNLSGLKLAGTINRRHVTLQDGLNDLGPINEPAVVNLRTPFNGRTYQAYADTLPSDHSGRALLLLLPPYRQGSLEVQSRYLLDAPVPVVATQSP